MFHFEEGVVVSLLSDKGVTKAKLRLFPSTDSPKCLACGRCFRPGGIENHAIADVDEEVAGELKEGMRVRVEVVVPPIYGPVLVVFGLPLLGLVAGGVFVYGMGWGELMVAGGALVGAVCGLLTAMFGFRKLMRRAERRFRVVGVAENLNEENNNI